MKKRKINTQPFWRFSFVLYCAVMLWLLFGRSSGWISGMPYRQMLEQHINLTPVQTICNYFYVIQGGPQGDGSLFTHCVINLLGNVLLFIPAGWLLPKLFPKQRNFFLFFVTCAGLILLVETVQLFTLLGYFDIDDLILNLVGMVLGFLAYQLGPALQRK